MKCTDFREDYQSFLDRTEQGEPPEGLRSHLNLCPGCTRYVSEMRGIDQALLAMPEVEIPPQLLTSLERLPESLREAQEPDPALLILRYVALALSALVIWIVGRFVSQEAQLLINGLILAAGAFAFTTGLLRPLYLNPLPDS
ncbi:MAG: hypothetical protein WBG01_03590 [Bacteroidota bacterium]